jgi:GLTT repeat (6 copies)
MEPLWDPVPVLLGLLEVPLWPVVSVVVLGLVLGLAELGLAELGLVELGLVACVCVLLAFGFDVVVVL